MTLVKMLERNSLEFPSKTAIIFQDKRISYGELNERVNKLARGLIEIGIKKGDPIGLMLPRTPELIISFLAIAKAQGIAAPINFELTPEKISEIFKCVSPALIIVHSKLLDHAKKAILGDMHIPLIVTDGNNSGEISFDEVIQKGNAENLRLDIKSEDVVYLNYTSGSTGNSKGAITTHSNIYWNTLASVDALGLKEDDIHLCMFAPFAHPHEIFARPLYLGGTMVILDTVYPKSLAEAISTCRVTCIMGLPPMYENLLELLEHKSYDLSSLRIPESGGMYTRNELVTKFKNKLGISIVPVWGSTETTGIAIANRPDEIMPEGSIGKECLSYEVRVVNESNEDVPTGEIGEIIFRGPAIVKGYYENGVNLNGSFKDGWYYSGDLGRKDEYGYYYFVERKTGMMKVAGLKVYPTEIELALLKHPDIKEVVVIAAKDNLRGEVPKAIITTKNNKTIKAKDILKFCKESLPNYKIPKIIEFRESLPKTGSGKINKISLQMEHA